MELDNIKLQTTWNDATGSINNNFAKLKLAIAEGVNNGLTLEEIADYLEGNGYINDLTKEMLSEVLGSEGNEGKYLVATEEGLGWKEVGTPDWNAQAGEDGYIKNKTHGFESQRGILTNNGDSCIWQSYYGNDLYIAIDGYPNAISIIKNAQAGNTYSINSGPPTYIEITSDYTGNKIITLVDNYEYHKFYPVRIFASVDTLDDIFIPSTIARKTDINGYATTDALGKVDARLASIEEYFSSEADADNLINKWNEIVAFLNATEGTTLASILNNYYTKVDVNNLISGLEKVAVTPTLVSGIKIAEITVGTTTKTLYAPSAPTLAGLMGSSAIGDTSSYIYWNGSKFATKALGSLAFKDSLAKGDVGLGNVDNLAASGYFTALSSSTTNAVSATIGGVTKSITVDVMKTSLGLSNYLTKEDAEKTYLKLSFRPL